MKASQNQKVTWKNVPTRTITAGGGEFAYRELGTNNPGTPVVFLIHLAAVLDNWDPRVVDGFAVSRRVFTFDNRGVGVFRIATSSSIPTPDTARCSSSTRTSCPRRSNSFHDKHSSARKTGHPLFLIRPKVKGDSASGL
jgi:hypothetical protein